MTVKDWTIRETKPGRYRVEPPTKRKGKTRARGFAPWKPQRESLELVEQVSAMLESLE